MTHKLREILLVSFFLLTFLFFASKGLWVGICGILLLFAAAFLLSPERCMSVLFFCFFFQIAFPAQVFGWPLLYQWVLLFWVGINLAGLALSKDGSKEQLPPYLRRAKTSAHLFLAALGCVMITRGAGLYRLGGTVIGGSQYILTILAVVGLLFSFRLAPLGKAWKRLFAMFIASSFFMLFLQYLIVCGNFWIKPYFGVGTMGLLSQQEGILGEMTSLARYSSLTLVSVSFLGIAAVFWGKRKKDGYLFCVLFALGFAALSGYRRALLSLPVILILFHFLHTEDKKRVFRFSALVGGGALVAAYFFAPHLSHTVQRALAVLPGISIDYDVSIAAKGSSEWRVEIWKYCLNEIPKYLLIGKGALLSVNDTIQNLGEIALMGHRTDIIFRAHAYHSIIMALLLDLGVPATLAYIGLIVYLGRYFFQLKQKLHGERYAVFCFLLAVWIDQQLHQLYTTGLLLNIVSNLLFAMFLLIVGSKAEDGDEDRMKSVGSRLKVRCGGA